MWNTRKVYELPILFRVRSVEYKIRNVSDAFTVLEEVLKALGCSRFCADDDADGAIYIYECGNKRVVAIYDAVENEVTVSIK